MNKYTLTFRCEKLEQKYQDSRYQYTLSTCKSLNIISFLLCLFRSITFIIQNQLSGFFVFLVLTIVAILAQFFIFTKSRRWVNYYLLIINHFMMLLPQYVEGEFEKQEAFILGQNQMLLHVMIILVSEFKFGSIQILGNIIIKIVLLKCYKSSLSYQSISYSVIFGLMFIYSIFKINQQYRLSFLYTTQDCQQAQLIPLLTDSPFILCKYDKDNLQFQSKFSNLLNHQEFKQFQTTNDVLNFILRNYFIFGQTLEKFLLARQKNQDELIVNKILEVKQNNNNNNYNNNNNNKNEQKLLIRYSECYITELIYILIIDKKRQEIQNLNQKIVNYEQGLNKVLIYFRNFLKQQILILDKSINKNQNSIYQAISKLIYLFSKFRNKKSSKIINQSFLLSFRKYAQLYSQAYENKNIKIEFCQEIKEIQTIENNLDEFMINFFNQLFKIKTDMIQIYLCKSFVQQNEFIDIIIKVDVISELYIKLQKCTNFRRILKTISPHDYVILNDNSLIVRLYKNMNEINQLSSFLIKAEQFKK